MERGLYKAQKTNITKLNHFLMEVIILIKDNTHINISQKK